MRVLVCGGRDFSDRAVLNRTLHELKVQQPYGTLVIIQGACRTGADKFARDWCEFQADAIHHLENYPAKWIDHGRAAGPIRNQRMIDEGKPDLVVAFPGGRGTADMVRRAKVAGIKTIEIDAALGGRA